MEAVDTLLAKKKRPKNARKLLNCGAIGAHSSVFRCFLDDVA